MLYVVWVELVDLVLVGHTSLAILALYPWLFFNLYGDHRDLHLSIRRQRQMCIRDRNKEHKVTQVNKVNKEHKGTQVNKVNKELKVCLFIHISETTRQAESSYAVFCLKKKKKTHSTHEHRKSNVLQENEYDINSHVDNTQLSLQQH